MTAKNAETAKTAKGMRIMANTKNVMNGAQHPVRGCACARPDRDLDAPAATANPKTWTPITELMNGARLPLHFIIYLCKV
jgi:hypothetical protein